MRLPYQTPSLQVNASIEYIAGEHGAFIVRNLADDEFALAAEKFAGRRIRGGFRLIVGKIGRRGRLRWAACIVAPGTGFGVRRDEGFAGVTATTNRRQGRDLHEAHRLTVVALTLLRRQIPSNHAARVLVLANGGRP